MVAVGKAGRLGLEWSCLFLLECLLSAHALPDGSMAQESVNCNSLGEM